MRLRVGLGVGAIFAALATLGLAARQQSMAITGPSPKPYVVPDLGARVAKFKRVRIPFYSQKLTGNERRMVTKLVDAAGLADCVYWRQSDPDGLQLYLSLAKSRDPQDLLLRRYLKLN